MCSGASSILRRYLVVFEGRLAIGNGLSGRGRFRFYVHRLSTWELPPGSARCENWYPSSAEYQRYQKRPTAYPSVCCSESTISSVDMPYRDSCITGRALNQFIFATVSLTLPDQSGDPISLFYGQRYGDQHRGKSYQYLHPVKACRAPAKDVFIARSNRQASKSLFCRFLPPQLVVEISIGISVNGLVQRLAPRFLARILVTGAVTRDSQRRSSAFC